MRAAARDLRVKGAALVLVKGGHLAGANGRAAVDVACDGDGLEELESEVVRCKPSAIVRLPACGVLAQGSPPVWGGQGPFCYGIGPGQEDAQRLSGPKEAR